MSPWLVYLNGAMIIFTLGIYLGAAVGAHLDWTHYVAKTRGWILGVCWWLATLFYVASVALYLVQQTGDVDPE